MVTDQDISVHYERADLLSAIEAGLDVSADARVPGIGRTARVMGADPPQKITNMVKGVAPGILPPLELICAKD